MLELKTFGGLRLEADGTPCAGAGVRPKPLALLALLAAGEQEVSRDKLITYLWPESDSAHGHHLLKQACHDLRRELRQPELFLGRKFLHLNPVVVATDVRRFETALEEGDRARAVAEYAGPFLDGFYLESSEEFERWVEGERERLARRAAGALQRLAQDAAAHAEQAAAAEWWRRLTELDPLSAEATLGRMTALAAAKERAEALKVGREYAELVRRELEADPSRAITKLMEQLRKQSDEPEVVRPYAVLLHGPAPPEASGTTGRSPEREGARPPPISGKRSAFLTGGLVVAALVAITIWRYPHPNPPVIAVATIRDFSGSDRALSPAVVEMLVNNLARVPELQVISTTQLAEIVSRMKADGDPRTAVHRAARHAGATELLEGALFRRPDGTLRLQLQLVALRTGVVQRAYVAEDRDPIALVDRLSVQLHQAFTPPH